MADIEMLRRKHHALPMVVALLLLGLFVWAAVELFENEEEALTVEVDDAQALPHLVPAFELVPVAVIVTAPESFAGAEVAGKAEVAEVVSDRGFWIKDQGERLFVVIDEPVPDAFYIHAGQKVELNGIIYKTQMADEILDALDPETRATLENESVFLYARTGDLRVMSRPRTTYTSGARI